MGQAVERSKAEGRGGESSDENFIQPRESPSRPETVRRDRQSLERADRSPTPPPRSSKRALREAKTHTCEHNIVDWLSFGTFSGFRLYWCCSYRYCNCYCYCSCYR